MLREKKRIGMIGNKNGFTLMELIIVMAILAVLVTLALLYYGNVGQDAYRNALMADLKAVDQAVTLYENNYGKLPVVESGAMDLEGKTNGNANVPATLKAAGKIDAYTINPTDANFMSYIKKTTYLLKGIETGDVRGAGKLFYIDAADDVVTSGTPAGAGTATTILLATDSNVDNDYYNGCTIYITGGKGVGQSRVISDYDYNAVGPICTATVSSAWATDNEPDGTSTYKIIPPVKAGDIVFVQSATTDRLVIKDSSGQAIYKY